MEKNTACRVFDCLSSPVRLDAFRLLVKHGPKGLVAGEIATELDVPPSSMSFHFKEMTYAGLITVEAEGRFLRYRANLELVHDLIAYLTDECCAAGGECNVLPVRATLKRQPYKPPAKSKARA